MAPRSTISKETWNLLNLVLSQVISSKSTTLHEFLFRSKEAELHRTDAEKVGLRQCYCVYNLYQKYRCYCAVLWTSTNGS